MRGFRRGRARTVVAVALAVVLSLAVVAVVLTRSTGTPSANAAACERVLDRYPTFNERPAALNPGLPVVGWNPYNYHGTTAQQTDILDTTVAMERNGMRAAGYGFVNLDDGWQGPRDAAGDITADPQRYGCGIEKLAAYVHSAGFRFGIYTSANTKSCGRRTGSGGHVQQDVSQFAEWGVDLIKLDWCGASYDPVAARGIVQSWQTAIKAAGRPMILMVNAGGAPSVLQQVGTVANAFRVEGDVCPLWSNAGHACGDQFHLGIKQYLRKPPWKMISGLVQPGHFADADMLEVGNGRLTNDEEQTQFTMWAMWSAPLIAGNNLTIMSPQVRQILCNRRIIAVDQDPLARAAQRLSTIGGVQYWRKVVKDGVVLAAVNLTDHPADIRLRLAQARLDGVKHVQDLWTGDTFKPTSYYGSTLRQHAVRVLEFTKT